MEVIKIGIIEDQALVRDNLSAFVTQVPSFELVGVTERVEDFLTLPEELTIDLLLLDIGLAGGMTGIEGIPKLTERWPQLDVLILSGYEDSERIFSALQAGAVGYISKKSSLVHIKEAVEIVHRGGSYMSPSIARKVIGFFAPKPPTDGAAHLTSRQQEIVNGLADGLSYKLIAARHHISVETVRDHIKKIYKKLGVNSKAEVIRKKLTGEI